MPGVDRDDIPLLNAATTSDATLFRNAQTIVRANLRNVPDLAALAAATGASPRRLTLAFRHCVGLTVSDYVREERLRKARRLLMESDHAVGAIAAAVGYNSAANFSTAFRERFGITPTGLRQAALFPATRHAAG
jgi:transcriptional regulator GlxA family with amidase domain